MRGLGGKMEIHQVQNLLWNSLLSGDLQTCTKLFITAAADSNITYEMAHGLPPCSPPPPSPLGPFFSSAPNNLNSQPPTSFAATSLHSPRGSSLSSVRPSPLPLSNLSPHKHRKSNEIKRREDQIPEIVLSKGPFIKHSDSVYLDEDNDEDGGYNKNAGNALGHNDVKNERYANVVDEEDEDDDDDDDDDLSELGLKEDGDRDGDCTALWLEEERGDFYGCTLIHVACGKGDLGAIEMLLQYGANIDSRDGKGRTPLHHCVLFNQLLSAKVLLSRGADSTIEDYSKKRPIDTAVLLGSMVDKEFVTIFSNF